MRSTFARMLCVTAFALLGPAVSAGTKEADCADARIRLKSADALIKRSLGQKADLERGLRRCQAELKAQRVMTCQGMVDAVKGVEETLKRQREDKKTIERWLAKTCR